MPAIQMTDKDRMLQIVGDQPDDSTFAELLRELAMRHVAQESLADAAAGRAISQEQLERKVESWFK